MEFHAAESARGHLHIDPTGWRRPDEAAPSVALLDEALRRRRRVSMAYERTDGSVVERLVDPHGLVAKGSTWYLVAAVVAPRPLIIGRTPMSS